MTQHHGISECDDKLRQSYSSTQSTLVWFVACAIAVTALSIAAAHAPSRIRLIGLFSIAFGLAVGWGVVWLTSQLHAEPGCRFTVVTAVLLSLIGLIGSTLQTSRLDEAFSLKSDKAALASRLIKEFERQVNKSGSDKPNCAEVTEFQKYLSRRLQNLGNWNSPWPECFWVSELVAAAIVAGWMSYQSLSAGARNVAAGSEV
jgi:hypothetical protein